jgi:ankyrin repeat protein
MLRARWDMASVLLRRGADIHHRPNSNMYVVTYLNFFHSNSSHSTSIMAIYERGRLEKNPSDHCYHDLLQGEDVSEILQLNVAHQIILGLSPQDLEEQVGVHPSLIHERDGFGRTPLHWAAALEDYHAAELLIEHGAKLEDMDKRLSTPLSLSATWNSGTELCELLISAGASIDGPEGCRSPLYCAVVRSKNTPIVPLLLKYRADPRGFHFGRSILSRAIMFGHTDCLRDIVHFGADIDGPPSSGKMPIMDAVIRDDLSCIDFMLQQKPRLDVFDNCGDSILAYVARYSSIPVMNFLAQTDLGGISVCSRDIERCWEYFENRNFSGELPTEEEYAAFRGFLESVVPDAVLRKIEDVDSDDSSTASDGSSSDEEEFEDAQEVIGE